MYIYAQFQFSRIARTLTWVPLACLCVWFSQVLMPTPAHAQASTAAINGRVLDSSGGVVPEAEVALRSVDTGVVRRTRTNTSGNYVLLNVLPGSYTLDISKTGFQKSQLTAFRLVVNQTATFDVSLQVGAVEQSVTVEAAGVEIQASTAELGATVTSRRVVDLPLNGRNFTQLLALTPGIAPVSVASNSGGADALPIGQFTFPSVNGQTNRSNYFMLDGLNNQGASFGTFVVAPIIDAIQEFKVQSHNDQAEFGQVMGGIVNVVTKSGTNDLHGSAWEYIRNDAFDARNFFLTSVTPFRQNHFGATAGGPIVIPKVYDGHNRTFFFLGYQGFRWRQPANTFYRVPTASNLQGDLSDWPKVIYNPYTTRSDPSNAGQYLRDPFSNNQIPASMIDPGILAYARATLPAPIYVGVGSYNQLDTTPQRKNVEEYTARVDQNLGAKDWIWFRYSGNRQDNTTSAGRQKLIYLTEFSTRNFGGTWVHTFNPSSNLEVQIGRARTIYPFNGVWTGVPATLRTDAGFSDNFTANFLGGKSLIPQMNVADFFSGGEGGADKWPTLIWNEKASYSKVVGSHIFKTGFELSSNNYRELGTSARVVYGTVQTSNPQSTSTSGSGLASFLLNIPDSGFRNNNVISTRWGGVLGFFFQDQWKVSPRLTVNLGLRYDRTFIPPYGRPEDNNTAVGNLDLNRGVYIVQSVPAACSQKGTAPCIPTADGKLPQYVEASPDGKFFHNSTDNWQPRIGFAYRIGAKTAIRSSFGIFFDNWAGVLQYAGNAQGTWPSVSNLSVSNLNYPSATQLTPSVKGSNPIPSSSSPASTPFNQVAYNKDPYGQSPYSLQYNFGIQQQIGSGLVTLNYVGSGGRRLDLGGFYNVARTPGPGNARDRSPYPYIAPTRYEWSWGRSSYQALQFLYDRRLSRGLTFVTSYTYSKSIDIGCSGWFGAEGCSVQNPYAFNSDRGASAFDLTHVLATNWVYELPFGPGKRFQTGRRAADYVLGNWQLNGIVTIRSGAPYNITVPGDIANTGNSSYMRANLVGNPNLSSPGPSPGYWINTAAFAAPAAYTFGNFGRDRLRADYFRNFDLSVFRQFRITESKRIEFRAEAFNTFNTPTFSAPAGSITSATFGKVTGIANSPRQLQLGLKILF
jgi:hypothetical protein